jgi:hypothetical protein
MILLILVGTPFAQADTYTDLTTAVTGIQRIFTVDTDGSTWLIGGDNGPNVALFSYNGTSPATDLSANLTDMSDVYAIGVDGSTWLIGGSGLSSTARLFKYNGTSFSSVSIPEINPIRAVASNGSLWLVGGDHWGGGPDIKVESYDGATLTPVDGFSMASVRAIDTNGSTWLVGGADSFTLYSYDGVNTPTNIESQINSMFVDDIATNGAVWMLCGEGTNRLYSYDGTTFTNLTSQVGDMSSIRAVATNGPMWLIGGDNSAGSARLYSYNGTTFTDLSANISTMSSVGSIATNGSTWLVGDSSGGGTSTLYRIDMAPTISGITAPSAPNTGSFTMTITGTNFGPGTTVKLTKDGQQDIVSGSVNVISSTQLTATFDLTGAALGSWNVAVTNSSNETDILANGFMITEGELPYTGR